MALDFLRTEHPVYQANAEEWARNERRMRGGRDIRLELQRFDWEEPRGEHYLARQLMATYLNFPDIHATTILGHLMAKAPRPGAGLDMGRLGDIGSRGRFSGSLAEKLYYNVDGVGNDGSQWDNWWMGRARLSMATGHRWIYVDHPKEAPLTAARQLAGLHPYLVDFSPVDVPLWNISRGQLNFAVVLLNEESPRLVGDSLEGLGEKTEYLLLVRRGFTALDQERLPFGQLGGWFRFDADLKLREFGDWRYTNGQIPMFPLFYERLASSRGYGKVVPSLNFSRSATAELGQLAVSYMNLASAADFDAWDAAKSEKYVMGADPAGWELMRQWLTRGSTMIPVPTNAETGQVPTLQDGSAGAVAAEVFTTRLNAKLEEARQLSVQEATSTPDSSGVSKVAGFGEYKAPRLVLHASELENAQNTALYFLEARAGIPRPMGHVIWTRDFELEPVTDAIESAFSVEKLAGLRSTEFRAKLMVRWLQLKSLISDEADVEALVAEYTRAMQEDAAQRAATEAAFGNF